MSTPEHTPPGPPGGSAAAPAPQGSSSGVPRILLVDDDLINQKVLANLLKRKGWIATAAASGRRCLELLAQETYDLLLLDIQMPEMDGFQTASEVRRLEGERAAAGSVPPGTRIPIVALTTVSLPGTREKCVASGMDEHLTKPVNTAELYSVIQRILRLPG